MNTKSFHAIGPSELRALRRETPGTAHHVHLNNAGASLPSAMIVNLINAYLQDEAENGGYETEALYQDALNCAYEDVARLVGAAAEEIALFENAGAAWLTAFNGLDLQPGDEMITSEYEYIGNLIAMIDSRKKGVIVNIIHNDTAGNFPLEALRAAITKKTKLIAVTHIASSAGGVLPVEAIGSIARAHQIPYLVDACQSIGQYPVDVAQIQCDMLSATGRKYLRGPRGTGLLYVKKSFQDRLKPVFIDWLAVAEITRDSYQLREDARRFELYEKSRALTLGIGRAARYALDIGLERIWARIQQLSAELRTALRSITGVEVLDKGAVLSGIVTFRIGGKSSLAVRNELIDQGIYVSFGSPQATLVYMENQQLTELVRASVHYYNTEEEIQKLARAVKNIAAPRTPTQAALNAPATSNLC